MSKVFHRSLLIALLLSFFAGQESLADFGGPFYRATMAGQPSASVYTVTGSIPNTSTTVTFTTPSNQITIGTTGSSAVLYVTFNGATATATAGLMVNPGSYFTYQGPALASINIIGASATGSYTVIAH